MLYTSMIIILNILGYHLCTINGFLIKNKHYPYMAYLHIYSYDNLFLCGGSIITKRTILTAAHCFDECKSCITDVVVGTNRRNLDGNVYKSSLIIKHDQYANVPIKPKPFDIALLIVEKYIIFGFKVKPIHLDRNGVDGGAVGVLTGWRGNKYSGEVSDYLQHMKLKILSNKECQKSSKKDTKILESHLCTFTKIGQGTCYGDSGSPLVTRRKVVGIVSGGEPCAIGYPDFYTRVSKYVTWIEKHQK